MRLETRQADRRSRILVYMLPETWTAIKAKISRKVVLLPSGDQDDCYAKYIKPNWPEIDYHQLAGGPRYGYGAQSGATQEDAVYLSAAWMNENVTSRGPLGAFYRVWGDGKQMVKDDIFDYFGLSGFTADELKAKGYIVWTPVQQKGSWLSEGDTSTFMNLLDNGLHAYEDGSYGGWGGRKRSAPPIQNASPQFAAVEAAGRNPAGAQQAGALGPAQSRGSRRTSPGVAGPPQPDFFPAVQRDFAARLKWSVTPRFADANHEPKVRIKGPLNVSAHPGETIRLEGEVSDPDGDAVIVNWWQYRVGSYANEVAVATPAAVATNFRIPDDAAPGQTIHLILEATDGGTPALTRYQRVIVTVAH